MQTLSVSRTVAPPRETWTPYTSSPRNHTLLIASWPSSSSGGTGASSSSGQHVGPRCLTARYLRLTPYTVLPPQQKERIDRSQMAREQIRSFRTVHLDYHPQESHLVTFKDPWSFPTLYHPECNNLVVRHMEEIAEKVHVARVASQDCANTPCRSPESALD